MAADHRVEPGRWRVETDRLLDRIALRFPRIETRRRPGGSCSDCWLICRGFSDDSALLYHLNPPTAITADSQVVDGPSSKRVPNLPLLPRHFRTHKLNSAATNDPVLGIALAARLRVLGDVWLLMSIALTIAAAVLLALAVLPAQQRAIDLLDRATVPVTPSPAPSLMPGPEHDAAAEWTAGAGRPAMSSGIFALLWPIVVVLMVIRPGSKTGV